MINRVLRAIRLDPTLYREVAEDKTAMTQATIIVVVVSFLSALGSFIALLMAKAGAGRAFLGFFTELLISGILLGWLAWAVLTYFVGTALFKGKTDIPEMLRALGFASAPRLLGFFSFIPCVGWLFVLAGWILALIAGFIAVREAMEFDTGKAILTVLISWVIALVLSLVIAAILGVGTAAVGSIFG